MPTNADDYLGSATGENPDTLHDEAPIPVEVTGAVTVRDFPARTFTTDQVAVGTIPTKIVGESRTRGAIILVNRGTAPCWIGTDQVTVGTGFNMPVGFQITLTGTGALYAIAAAVDTSTINVLAQHRDG